MEQDSPNQQLFNGGKSLEVERPENHGTNINTFFYKISRHDFINWGIDHLDLMRVAEYAFWFSKLTPYRVWDT